MALYASSMRCLLLASLLLLTVSANARLIVPSPNCLKKVEDCIAWQSHTNSHIHSEWTFGFCDSRVKSAVSLGNVVDISFACSIRICNDLLCIVRVCGAQNETIGMVVVDMDACHIGPIEILTSFPNPTSPTAIGRDHGCHSLAVIIFIVASMSESDNSARKKLRVGDAPQPIPLAPLSYSVEERKALRSTFVNAKPFPHLTVSDLCDDAFLRTVRDEIIEHLKADYKETDIFKVLQTGMIRSTDRRTILFRSAAVQEIWQIWTRPTKRYSLC